MSQKLSEQLLQPGANEAAPRPGISVFFPAYYNEYTIPSLVLMALATCRELTDDYEVIVVIDGSPDETAKLMQDLGRLDPKHIKVVQHIKNRGYGGALRSGFENATKELVFYTDGDAQYDPRELKLLYEKMRPGIGMVNGYKIERNDPLHRIIIGKVYHWGVKLAFGLKLKDTDCDFRLVRKSALNKIRLNSNSGAITVELQKKLMDTGCKFDQVPVHHLHRASGKSQFFNFPRIARTLIQLSSLWWQLVIVREHIKNLPETEREAVATPAADSQRD